MVDTAALREIALRAATRGDDPHPTAIHWVLSSRTAIAALVGWGLPAAEDGSRQQILLVVTGHFTLHHVSRPRRAKPPTGTVLTLVLDLDLTVTDFGCRPAPLDASGVAAMQSIPVA